MSDKTVREAIASLSRALARFIPFDPDAAPDIMAVIYEAIAALPSVHLQDLETIGEEGLRARARQRALDIAEGQLGVSTDHPNPLTDAFILLRAVEQVFLQYDRAIEGDGERDLEDACRTTDGRHFVLGHVREVGTLDGKPFIRRALLAHRILPATAGGLTVRLYRTPTLGAAASAASDRLAGPRNYGAAFFPNLKLGISSGEKSFTAQSATGFDAAKVIRQQVEDARGARCRGLVWAELTMPDESVAELRKELADQALADGVAPEFVIAGSWHREIQGQIQNVATIFDGVGGEIFRLTKWARFKIDGRTEDIVPGNEIPILLTEDKLAVLAICRDFLDDVQEGPYASLNVDLAFVPSMAPEVGRVATLRAHAATANSMRVRFGTRTLVVLQPPEPAGAAFGHVLAFPDKPLETDAAEAHAVLVPCSLASR